MASRGESYFEQSEKNTNEDLKWHKILNNGGVRALCGLNPISTNFFLLVYIYLNIFGVIIFLIINKYIVPFHMQTMHRALFAPNVLSTQAETKKARERRVLLPLFIKSF